VKEGRRVATDRPRDYEVLYLGGTEPVLSVRRPYAYLVPKELAKVTENLQRHGIDVEELREDIELDVEVYRVDTITRTMQFQKHQPVSLEATPRKESRRVEAGTVLVRTAQPLGSLAAYLLEPQSADGLATWNFFDAVLAEGKDFRSCVCPRRRRSPRARCGPAEDRIMNRPITFETLYAAERPLSFAGNPVTGLVWLEDGEHFLQVKEAGCARLTR